MKKCLFIILFICVFMFSVNVFATDVKSLQGQEGNDTFQISETEIKELESTDEDSIKLNDNTSNIGSDVDENVLDGIKEYRDSNDNVQNKNYLMYIVIILLIVIIVSLVYMGKNKK